MWQIKSISSLAKMRFKSSTKMVSDYAIFTISLFRHFSWVMLNFAGFVPLFTLDLWRPQVRGCEDLHVISIFSLVTPSFLRASRTQARYSLLPNQHTGPHTIVCTEHEARYIVSRGADHSTSAFLGGLRSTDRLWTDRPDFCRGRVS